jgi:predicted SAM-dependent methyltransferase
MNERIVTWVHRSAILTAIARFIRFWVIFFLNGGRWIWVRLRSRGQICRYISSAGARKLNLGAGRLPFPGWLNVDLHPRKGVVFLDARKPLPFPDGVFDCIFSEHLIEHLDYPAGMRMLRECIRVLRPGGKIRLATPNLEPILHLYEDEEKEENRRYMIQAVEKFPKIGQAKAVFVINNFFRDWGHRFIYDGQTLRGSLAAAGFENISLYPVGRSEVEAFVGLESHQKEIGEFMNSFETLVMEGTRVIPNSHKSAGGPGGGEGSR